MDTLPELLSRHAHRIWAASTARPVGPHISTGYRDLDTAIGGGWPTGTLVEIMTLGGGLGWSALVLPVLATLTQAGKAIAWLPAPDERPYEPTLRQAGINLNRVVVTSTQDHHQRLWGAEQCLRHSGVGAVVLTETRTIKDTLLQRLKLAASSGSATAFVLRGEEAMELASPAAIRIRVRSAALALHQREVSIFKFGDHLPRRVTLDLEARN